MSEATTAISMQNELYKYKQKIIEMIASHKDITDAIVTDVDPSELVYNNIFPFGVLEFVQNDTSTCITVEVTMPSVSTKNYFFKDVLVVINVICHNDTMKTDFSIPRHDYISAKICEILNGSDELGYGELELVSNTESAFTERHSGRTMRFQTQEMAKTNLCI